MRTVVNASQSRWWMRTTVVELVQAHCITLWVSVLWPLLSSTHTFMHGVGLACKSDPDQVKGRTEKSCQPTIWECVANWEAILWPRIRWLAFQPLQTHFFSVMCLNWLNIPQFIFNQLAERNTSVWLSWKVCGKIRQCVSNCPAGRLPGVININSEVSRKAQSGLSVCTSFDQGERPTGRRAARDVKLCSRPWLTKALS